MDVNGWWGTHGNDIQRTLYLLFLGQVISFVRSLMSFTSSLLATLGVDTPLTLSCFVYLALSLVYGSIFIYRRQKLQVPWYWYLLIGIADVQGNFLGKAVASIVLDIDVPIFVAVNQAFQYSSITSVTILDCWTIAWVILLTWYFLELDIPYGSSLVLLSVWQGLDLVLLSDAGVGGGGGSRPLLGDTFVIMGTLFYALSNVGEEICVKKKDLIEVITMMAISGLVVSICEIAILETKGLASVKWSPEIILAFAGFAFAGFLFYTFVPFLLKVNLDPSSSVFSTGSHFQYDKAYNYKFKLLVETEHIFQLSCDYESECYLCCDTDERSHAVQSLASNVDWLYYVAFGLVGIGLVVYSKTEKALDSAPAIGDGSQYQILDEECRDARNDDHKFEGNLTIEPWIRVYFTRVLDIDVPIFVAVNQAFQYSSITSVTILDCWTIAWVILLTWYFLGTRYSLWQFFGAAVCVAGLGLILLSDAGVGGGGGSRPLLGDTFVIMGTLFYALSNVGEEICVKKKDRIEVITMMAISGLLVSICEIAILETKGLASVKWSPEIILAFAGFAFAGFLFYTFVPFLLKVDWLYYVAFGLVGIGLVVYSKTEKALDSAPAIGDGSQYQILDEECRDARNDDIGFQLVPASGNSKKKAAGSGALSPISWATPNQTPSGYHSGADSYRS
nr:solute carrier family 35 member F1-like isoform X1 [Ipomoea batatas]